LQIYSDVKTEIRKRALPLASRPWGHLADISPPALKHEKTPFHQGVFASSDERT
jgi:hypothetical protein